MLYFLFGASSWRSSAFSRYTAEQRVYMLISFSIRWIKFYKGVWIEEFGKIADANPFNKSKMHLCSTLVTRIRGYDFLMAMLLLVVHTYASMFDMGIGIHWLISI